MNPVHAGREIPIPSVPHITFASDLYLGAGAWAQTGRSQSRLFQTAPHGIIGLEFISGSAGSAECTQSGASSRGAGAPRPRVWQRGDPAPGGPVEAALRVRARDVPKTQYL